MHADYIRLLFSPEQCHSSSLKYALSKNKHELNGEELIMIPLGSSNICKSFLI